MINILIVDDEPLVQVGLKSMLSNGFDDLQVCGMASNGREALSLIGSLHPDIVFSDIKMPLMGGLELIKESEALYGPIPVFIMLTAYEDFDMVRQAMGAQAVAYLVKMELNPRILSDTLELARKRLAERGRREEPSLPLEEYRQRLLLNLLEGKMESLEDLRSQAGALSMSFEDKRFWVACVGLGGSGQEDKNVPLYTSAAQMGKEIMGRHLPCHFITLDLSHYCFLFPFSDTQPVADIRARIQDGLENARAMTASYFSLPLYAGIGNAVTSPLDLHEAYEEARMALESANDDIPCRLFAHLVGANRRSGKDRLIASIQAYVEENLDGKLQLAEVASVFGLSPAYLSTVFKKNTDVGFSEYVTGKKMEKARQLLLEGDMKIYEVADALGFESAYYFSKVFHKSIGVSPREFIQKKSGT